MKSKKSIELVALFGPQRLTKPDSVVAKILWLAGQDNVAEAISTVVSVGESHVLVTSMKRFVRYGLLQKPATTSALRIRTFVKDVISCFD